jgi:methylenetetrahydrofolate--tRNA-(uracil-5-)-methyltransferase
VVQLRQDNALGTLWNMVCFQTKLKYGRQAEIFRLIPGLENAQFARLGGLHHNTFLNSPKVLDRQLRLKVQPRLRFAGQITGVEGYVESAAIGLVAGRMAAAQARDDIIEPPAVTTALGALFDHILGGHIAAEGEPGPRSFQPMNVNFGLLPPVTVSKPEGHEGRWRGPEKAQAKKKAMSERALADIAGWA